MQQHGWTWKTLSQAEKDKYCMISPLCEILKKKTRLIETETRLLVARRQRSGVGHKAGGGGGGRGRGGEPKTLAPSQDPRGIHPMRKFKTEK